MFVVSPFVWLNAASCQSGFAATQLKCRFISMYLYCMTRQKCHSSGNYWQPWFIPLHSLSVHSHRSHIKRTRQLSSHSLPADVSTTQSVTIAKNTNFTSRLLKIGIWRRKFCLILCFDAEHASAAMAGV